MNQLPGKRILIFQQRMWSINIGHFLSKKLKDEGCKLAALTFKKSTHKFILEQKDVEYELVINNDEVMENPLKYLNGEQYPLSEICEALGIDTIWPIVSTLRNHVKSYKEKYYYGFKQNLPDEEIIDYVMAVYKYAKIFFEKFNPDIIIAPNFVTFPHILINMMADRKGVAMLAITDSKVRGYRIFSHSYHDNRGSFFNRVDALNNGLAETENKERAKQYIREFREKFKQPDYFKTAKKHDLWRRIKQELYPYKLILSWYIKGPTPNHLKNIGITTDYKPPKIILRDHYCHKINKRFIEKFDYYPLEKLGKFVYFPLQFQPEATMDVMAPYFNNQIETARLTAMSLPGDYTLAVKEHPAMVGLRSNSYIEKIARTVNIKLIDYRIPSEEILKRADLVISPNSTTLAEAAFLSKPAIQFGDLGTTMKLPNVFRHTDFTSLSAKIKEVLGKNLKTDEYERRLENFVAAVYDTGFDFKYGIVWSKGRGDDMEILWSIYKKELLNYIK